MPVCAPVECRFAPDRQRTRLCPKPSKLCSTTCPNTSQLHYSQNFGFFIARPVPQVIAMFERMEADFVRTDLWDQSLFDECGQNFLKDEERDLIHPLQVRRREMTRSTVAAI